MVHSECTKDGLKAVKLRGSKLGRLNLDIEKVKAAIKLIESGNSITKVAKQLGLGRSTLYREIQITKS